MSRSPTRPYRLEDMPFDSDRLAVIVEREGADDLGRELLAKRPLLATMQAEGRACVEALPCAGRVSLSKRRA